MSSSSSSNHLEFMEELGFKDQHFLSQISLTLIFVAYQSMLVINNLWEKMRCKRKANKGGSELVDELFEGARSSTCENQIEDLARSPRSLQDAKCIIFSRDVFYVSKESDIELLYEVQATAQDKDELGEAKTTAPQIIINVFKIKELLERMGKSKAGQAEPNGDKAPLNVVEGAQDNEKSQSSTSSYKSKDSYKDDMLVNNTLKKLGVNVIIVEYQVTSLSAYPV